VLFAVSVLALSEEAEAVEESDEVDEVPLVDAPLSVEPDAESGLLVDRRG
jgi:hypothetical protein